MEFKRGSLFVEVDVSIFLLPLFSSNYNLGYSLTILKINKKKERNKEVRKKRNGITVN